MTNHLYLFLCRKQSCLIFQNKFFFLIASYTHAALQLLHLLDAQTIIIDIVICTLLAGVDAEAGAGGSVCPASYSREPLLACCR